MDEIFWLGIGEPDFAGYIKTAWDTLFSQHPRLVVVLCGSVSSWIVGLQFENLVLGNLAIILDRVGLSNVPVLNAGPYFQARTARRPGCQVDLLLRTKHSLYVFEVKFRGKIDNSVIAEVRKKIDCLDGVAGLSIRRGLIYQGEVVPELARSDYFDHLVPFERLLVP